MYILRRNGCYIMMELTRTSIHVLIDDEGYRLLHDCIHEMNADRNVIIETLIRKAQYDGLQELYRCGQQT